MSHHRPLSRSLSIPVVLAGFLTAAGIFAAPLAHAQDWYNPVTGHTFNNPTSSLMDTMIQNRLQEQAFAQALRQPQDNEAPEPVAPQHRPLSATDFRPARRGHPTAGALVAAVPNRVHRKQLGIAIDAKFARIAALRANNMAIALADAIAMAQELVSDQEVTAEAFESLLVGFNDGLAVAPTYTKLPRAKKQALYEYLIFNSTILALAIEVGDTDPAAKASAVTLANNLLQQFGGAPTGTADR